MHRHRRCIAMVGVRRDVGVVFTGVAAFRGLGQKRLYQVAVIVLLDNILPGNYLFLAVLTWP